ncbi:MAG: hypothetical protein V4850_28000 [Myxococcota bacterium]
MSDEPIDELARLARERRGRVDPRWDALTRGELGEAERAALLAEDDAARLAPLFEPLGDAFADAMTARLLGGAPAARIDEAPPDVVPLRAPAAEPAPRPPPRLRPWMRVAAPLLALAAAALLTVSLRDPDGVPDPLPAYALEVQGGDRALRAGEAPVADVLRLSPGSRVTVVARPERDVVSPVTAEARVVPRAGNPVPWSGGLEVSPAGAVRLAGTIGSDLHLPPGEAVIELSVRAGGAERVLTVPIVVVD